MTDDDDDRLALDAWTAPPPPAGLADRVLAAVHGGVTAVEAVPPPRSRWRRNAAIAAALLAAAAAVTFALLPTDEPDHRGQLTATAPSLVALDDDVEATVEAGAQLSWHSAGGGLVVRHDAGIVTYRHRGDRRLVVVTPAGTLTSERAAFRVEVPVKRDLIVGGSAAAVAALAVVAVYQGRVQAKEPSRAPVTIAAGQQLTLGTASTPTTPARPIAVATAAVDRTRRAALAQAIAAARQARPGGAAAPAPAVVGAAPPALSKEQIRLGVKEIVPMLTDCYEEQLDANPKVGRTNVEAKLTIDSEPDLGTVVAVNSFTIDGVLAQSTDFHDCLTATLEAMVLPPMPDGGRIDVTYPLVFAPNDDAPASPAVSAMNKPNKTTNQPAPRPDRIDLPPPPPAPVDVITVVNDASVAAMSGQWARALALAEQALALPDINAASRTKAITVAALAACNLHDAKKARKYYVQASHSSQAMLAQRCLAVARIDLEKP